MVILREISQVCKGKSCGFLSFRSPRYMKLLMCLYKSWKQREMRRREMEGEESRVKRDRRRVDTVKVHHTQEVSV